MFGLEARHLEFVMNTLRKNIPDKSTKFYIFGSRAKGSHREYSDIDIAVDSNGQKLDENVLGALLLEFEDWTLPYEVDVVDLNAIDESFKNLIKSSLIEL